MLGAVFSEMDEDRSTGRWLTEESIARAANESAMGVPTPTYEGGAEEHAGRIIEVVVADNPVGRQAAWIMG